MRRMFPLQLLMKVLLSLALLTTCYPRPASISLISTIDSISTASHSQIGETYTQSLQSDERGTSSNIRPRGLVGFQEFLDIGSGWNMYYSSRSAIALPVQPAAWAFAHLYSSILIDARGKWARSPPLHGFTLSYGGVRILMHCPQKPIPWLFVGNFAEKLLQITESGWTGVYQVMLSQAENDVSIGVHLSVVAT